MYDRQVAMVTTQNPEMAISKYPQVRHPSKTWSRLKICINMIEMCIIITDYMIAFGTLKRFNFE